MIGKIGSILYGHFRNGMGLVCKIQAALLSHCLYTALYQLFPPRKMGHYNKQELLAEHKGLHRLDVAATQSFASHRSAPLQWTSSSASPVCKGTSSTSLRQVNISQ